MRRGHLPQPFSLSLSQIDPHVIAFLQTTFLAPHFYPHQIDTMVDESRVSASDLQGAADALLIQCTDECRRAQVVQWVSKKSWSLGEVF
jgi:hypothetical protein